MSKKQSNESRNHTQLKQNNSRPRKDDINHANKRVRTTSCVLNINSDNVNLRFDMRTNHSAITPLTD